MRVIIIEDEKPAARRLSRMLLEFGINPEIMLHSVEEAIHWFYNNEHPDVIFLDIQLSDGLSFEIFEEIEINSAIIFTTAYDQYAIKAFKLNSIDYLLKPIEEEALQGSIAKYKKFSSKQLTKFNLETIQNLLTVSEIAYKNRFVVKIGQHIHIVQTKDVACVYSQNKGTYLFSKGRNYLIDNTLEQLTTLLNPKKYFRVNRTFYVSIDYIEDIIAYTNSRLKIKIAGFKEEEIIVSRERVKAFKKWLS